MHTVKAHFAVAPYARDPRQVTVLRVASVVYPTRVAALEAARAAGGGPVLDEKAKRAARDRRIDDLMDVVEALHGETLAELAK